MSRDTKVKVTIETTGEARVRAALRGITTEAERASKQMAAAAQRSSKTTETTEQRSAATRRNIQKQVATDAEQAEKRKRAALRETTRESETQARQQMRTAQRMRSRFGGAVMRFGAAGFAGAAAGAMQLSGRAQSYQAAIGVKTREELVRTAIEFRQNFIRMSERAGLTVEERRNALQRVTSVAERTGVDPSNLIGGLLEAQGSFDAVRSFIASLDQVANVTRAYGIESRDVVGVLGEARRQFGLTDDELKGFTGTIAEAANRGSMEFPEFASSFRDTLGSIMRGTQLRGAAGANQAVQIAEVMAMGGQHAPEVATSVNRFITELNTAKTQKELRTRYGVETTMLTGQTETVRDARGREVQVQTRRLRPILDIINDLNATMLRVDPARRQQLFRELRGRRGAEIMMSMVRENPTQVERIMATSPETGNAYVARVVEALNADVSGRALRIGVHQQADFLGGGKDREFIATVTSLVGPLTELQSKYPMLSESMATATTALGAFTAALVLQGIMRPGAGAGALGVIPRLLNPVAGPGAAGGAGLSFLGAAGIGLAIGSMIPLDDRTGWGADAAAYRRRQTSVTRRELAGSGEMNSTPEGIEALRHLDPTLRRRVLTEARDVTGRGPSAGFGAPLTAEMVNSIAMAVQNGIGRAQIVVSVDSPPGSGGVATRNRPGTPPRHQ